MALGSYSVVRYSNHLNDQRVNLGVLLWHPIDGMKCRFSPSLDRVHAVDPRALLTPLKKQLDAIEGELQQDASGGAKLTELSRWFKEGLEVAPPYPAQIQSADETVEHLYQMLVSPVQEIRRASTQQQFERKVTSALVRTAAHLRVPCENIGRRKVRDLTVTIGVRTGKADHRTLWRAVSLQAHDHPERQLAFAKAAAMDINVVRADAAYRADRQYVTLQGPKRSAMAGLEESRKWLDSVADKVFVIESAEAVPGVLEKALLK